MFLHNTLDQGSLLQFLESLDLIQIGVSEGRVEVIGCDSHVAVVIRFITDLLDLEPSDSFLYSVVWIILLKLLTFLSVELVVGHHLVDQQRLGIQSGLRYNLPFGCGVGVSTLKL